MGVHRDTVGAPRNYSGHDLYFQLMVPVITVRVPCNWTYPRADMTPTLEQATKHVSRHPARPASRPSCSEGVALPLGAVVAPADISSAQWAGVHLCSGGAVEVTVGVPRSYSGYDLYFQWVGPVVTVGVPCSWTYPRANMSPTLERTTRVSSLCPARPAPRPSCSERVALPLRAVVAPAETCPCWNMSSHQYDAVYSGCIM